MPEFSEPEIQESHKPRSKDVSYDLERALSSVVSIRTKIPEDAFTASILGTERAGNGVIIDETGLILTIGYLITEAETVWIMGADGRACPGHIVAYDQETGFGLVQALENMGLPALPIGSSGDIRVGESVVIAGYGGREHACKAQIVAKREFAGYWEYVLDEAIFTAPAHPSWGGAALIDADGRLAGIGSLFVQLPRGEDKPLDGNMIVPIDILIPIMNQLMKFGKVDRPPRPWLGMYTAEAEDELVVVGLAEDGPAYDAGVEIGDRVLEVNGEPVITLVDMFRQIWRVGDAGVQVPLTVWRDDGAISLGVPSIDRTSLLKKPQLH
ncbi:MAG: serine protease [Rhodospirillales bacterium]|jgi:S1-C subfamily serine protease|nr:serine protease [Rhodospirillales bacterium]